MVLTTDIQVAYIAGAFFVDMGRNYIEMEHKASPERSKLAGQRFRIMAILYASLILVPALIVSFLAWPAWESQYWTACAEEMRDHGSYAVFMGLFLATAVGAGCLGSWLSFKWLIEGKGKRIRPVYLAVIAVTMVLYFYQWPGPIVLGSVADFRKDPYSLSRIWQNTEFFIIYIALLIYCAVPFVYGFFKLRRRII